MKNGLLFLTVQKICKWWKNLELLVYKGLNIDDPTKVIIIEQGEEGKLIDMFKDPAVKHLIESSGHIYDSTVISSYF